MTNTTPCSGLISTSDDYCARPARYWVRPPVAGAAESPACGAHLAQIVQWVADGAWEGAEPVVRIGRGAR